MIPLLSISFSHGEKLVAAGCKDSIIRIWDSQTGHLVERLRGHDGAVYSVTFTQDDKGLISGSEDGKVKFWDLTLFLESNERMQPLIPAASYAPMSTLVPNLTAGTPARDGSERGAISTATCTFSGHDGTVNSVAVSLGGQWVISGSDDKSVLFWDARNAQAIFSLHGHKGIIWSVDVSPTGCIFATGGRDGIVRICELYCSMSFKAVHSDYTQGNTVI